MSEPETLVMSSDQGTAFQEGLETLNRALDNARIAQQVAANEEAAFRRLCRVLGFKAEAFVEYDKLTQTVTLRPEE